MPNLPGVSGRRAVKALERLGFVFIRQKGSHVILRRRDRLSAAASALRVLRG
jgi:predicted RNA binding protein YcfA (HicA-like mRNA interferase family)